MRQRASVPVQRSNRLFGLVVHGWELCAVAEVEAVFSMAVRTEIREIDTFKQQNKRIDEAFHLIWDVIPRGMVRLKDDSTSKVMANAPSKPPWWVMLSSALKIGDLLCKGENVPNWWRGIVGGRWNIMSILIDLILYDWLNENNYQYYLNRDTWLVQIICSLTVASPIPESALETFKFWIKFKSAV